MDELEIPRIPRYLDSMPQILFWELDDMMFLVSGVFMGIGTGHVLIGMLLGALATRYYARAKEQHLPGYLVHWLYFRAGLSPVRSLRPGWIREFQE
ncbi:MAG: type IV conjugative transfer system protein TraL [Pseudomonadota bacterium]